MTNDCGNVSLTAVLVDRLVRQYGDHPHWSYQPHHDNLAALVKADPALGPLRSYSTVNRYIQADRLVHKPRVQASECPGEVRAENNRQTQEIRSYEATHIGAPGISISTTDHSRCSVPAASDCARLC